MDISPSLSALNAFAVGVHGAAYNIANVSTDGFESVTVDYRSGFPEDQGVQAVVNRPESRDQVHISPDARLAGNVNPSNSDPAREFTNMILDQRAFEANTKVISTYDAMAGTVLDITT